MGRLGASVHHACFDQDLDLFVPFAYRQHGQGQGSDVYDYWGHDTVHERVRLSILGGLQTVESVLGRQS